MAGKEKSAKQPKVPMLERVFGTEFRPKPTVIPSGVDKMIACFEELRGLNGGGWGGGFLKRIQPWHFDAHVGTTISCSPFTGTVIGMMFDPGEDGHGVDPKGNDFAPMFDGGTRPIHAWFYQFHNTSLPDSKSKKHPGQLGWREALAYLKTIGVERKPGLASHYGCVGSTALWNLGYQIDPRDLRRGDLVHIDWVNGHGHATLCWDVHLGDHGEVDAFQFVSANGGGKGDVGVSVSTKPSEHFVDKVNGVWRKNPKYDPLFVDRPEFVTLGSWKTLPGQPTTVEQLKKSTTFKPSPPKTFDKLKAKTVEVLRFWGFPPPDPATERGKAAWSDPLYNDKFEQAQKLARFTQPEPYCMGTGRSVTVAASSTPAVVLPPEKAKKPEDLAKVPARPVTQKPSEVSAEQLAVERALETLFRAGYIEHSPGDLNSVYDQDSMLAIKSFQKRWGLHDDGVAGDVTRPLLFAAAADVRAGKTLTPKPPAAVARPPAKPAPGAAPPPPPPPARPGEGTVLLGPLSAQEPRLDHFYLLHNHAAPGAELAFVVEGKDLDVWNFSNGTLTLTEKTHGTKVEISAVVPFTVGGRGQGTVRLPQALTAGSVWTAALACKIPRGPTVHAACPIELHIDTQPPVAAAPLDSGAWPWDERAWPKIMKDILQDLRATTVPSGLTMERWAFSTYGVKEKLTSVGPREKKTGKLRFADGGNLVPVLDKSGKEYGKATRYSLFAADIEGTMRLAGRMLNITQTGRPRHGKPPHRYEEFDHTLSKWADVTDRHPWGSGSVVPLIPYRVLAINKAADSRLYFKKVYIKALDGRTLPPTGEKHNGVCLVGDCGSMDPGKQFDFFKGRQDVTFTIDGGLGMFKNSKGVSLPLSEVAFLDECLVAHRKKKK